MSLKESITSAINANLPQAVAGELQTFIANANNESERLKVNEKELKSALEKISVLQKELERHEDLDKKTLLLHAREMEVREKENSMRVTVAELKTEEAEKRVKIAYDLTALAFRNPTFKTHEGTQTPIYVPGYQPGQPGGVQTHYSTVSKTVEQE